MLHVFRVLEADLPHGHIVLLLPVLGEPLDVLLRNDVVLLRVQEHVRPQGRLFVQQALQWALVQQRPLPRNQVLDNTVAVLRNPDAHQAHGDEQGHHKGASSVDGGQRAVQRREAPLTRGRVKDTAADVEVALVAVARVLDGQQNVHVHVGASVAEQVHENGIVLKVHVEDELEHLFAQQLHVAPLPEQAIYRCGVAHGYQSGKGWRFMGGLEIWSYSGVTESIVGVVCIKGDMIDY